MFAKKVRVWILLIKIKYTGKIGVKDFAFNDDQYCILIL